MNSPWIVAIVVVLLVLIFLLAADAITWNGV
jgi:hypothetical protein